MSLAILQKNHPLLCYKLRISPPRLHRTISTFKTCIRRPLLNIISTWRREKPLRGVLRNPSHHLNHGLTPPPHPPAQTVIPPSHPSSDPSPPPLVLHAATSLSPSLQRRSTTLPPLNDQMEWFRRQYGIISGGVVTITRKNGVLRYSCRVCVPVICV
jgi:hypothetical protein